MSDLVTVGVLDWFVEEQRMDLGGTGEWVFIKCEDNGTKLLGTIQSNASS